jgi:prophage maintenance system killer protein
MDILCLMFESPRRGYLITNGKPWTLHQIAVALSGDWQENLVYLNELVKNGVMKQAPRQKKCPLKSEAFFSARIVEDERSREVWRSQKRRQRIDNKRKVSTPVSSPSSSSSSSSSSIQNIKSKAEEDTYDKAAAAFQSIGFEHPFGHANFQAVFLDEYLNPKGRWITQIMEAAIQRCQGERIGIPPQFFDAKRDVEARENASVKGRVPL